jgi:hypothetical protein
MIRILERTHEVDIEFPLCYKFAGRERMRKSWENKKIERNSCRHKSSEIRMLSVALPVI